MIYFDNAATSFPKSPRAIAEATVCMRTWCGNPGRGAHFLSRAASEKVYACRELLSDFLGLNAPERIVFTQNTTFALNMALKGALRHGDHVLCSELEHNAVLRPLHALQQERGISFDTFPVVGRTAEQILQEITTRIKKNTDAVVCLHASNICSISLPLTRIGALCHARGLLLMVDAAQSAGHLPIDMHTMQIDALAVPAHKGLLGIPGCGVLALGERISLSTLIEGGSGVNSLSRTMPEEFPERFEAGTLPVVAIAGLCGGISHVMELGSTELENRAKGLFFAARERIEALGGFEIYEPTAAGAVLLFNKIGMSSTELARILDKAGICTRAGLHCAPLAHQALKTPTGGAVRLSFSAFNTSAEVDVLWRVLQHEFCQ
ncbi:MAG: aminotransferase class V-fold PLP-dependent enzyme [Clostridia bacterium]|nr:aminotransferase class V-fold PLP-dependent enzyme [Clostridia bacterium]